MTRTIDVPAKPVWQSWTFWINLLSAIAMIIEAVTVENLLPSPWNERALGLLAIVNVALRFKSNQPVALSGGQTRTVTATPASSSRSTPTLLLVLALIPAMLFLLAFNAFLATVLA
jgi:ABC-type histidine transport system ATPase subunit